MTTYYEWAERQGRRATAVDVSTSTVPPREDETVRTIRKALDARKLRKLAVVTRPDSYGKAR